jgi:hypothetical protein
MNFTNLAWPDTIALYAAIVATGALALEVRRWFESGVHIKIDAAADMVLINVPDLEPDGSWVVVTVTNVGTSPVTITTLGIRRYRTRLHWIFRKPTGHGVVVNPDLPGHVPSIPRLLNPGERWQGFMKQTAQISTEINAEIFQVGVWCADRKSPRVRRVFCQPEAE